MAAIDFPNPATQTPVNTFSPTSTPSATANGVTYTWDGAKWVAQVAGGGGATDKIEEGNTSAEVIDTGSDGRFVVTTEGSERARVDSSGRLLVGTSSSTTGASSQYAPLQVIGNKSSATDRGAIVNLGHSAASASITTGEQIGAIMFTDNAAGEYGQIGCYADANAGSSDYPGRLAFFTTADGASSPTARLTLYQNGSAGFLNTKDVYPGTDNFTPLGVNGARWSAVWAANGTIQTSDERAKTDITDAQLGSDFIKALRPVSYKWIEGGKRDTGERDEDNNYIYESVPGQRTHWGFIAQEVKQAVDAAGVDFGGWVLTNKDDPDSQQALRYDQFIAPLTKALQEALAKIETLEAANTDLAARITALEGGN